MADATRQQPGGPRALLVSMPFLFPITPSYALGLLGARLRAEGLATDRLYGSLCWPKTPLFDDPEGHVFLNNYGGLLCGAFLGRRSPEGRRRFLDALYADGLAPEVLDGRDKLSRETVEAEAQRAERCLDACLAAATARPYDVVGFSVTFYTQLPPSIALAQRIAAARPGTRIVFGGVACHGEQADGLLRSFPFLDAVADSEADDTIAPLFRALRGDGALADVPGLVYRASDGRPRRTPPPPLCATLDDLPVPDYDDYYADFAASEWAEYTPTISYETSRGCWWGRCAFCGQRERELAFRTKSADRVFREIITLHARYPQVRFFHSTDNVLDMRFLRTLVPRLARWRHEQPDPPELFFEVRSHLKARQLLLLAHAGVRTVQPGIESFSDGVLKLMNKGRSALDQVRFIKWGMQAGLRVIYNLMIRNIGETAGDYREMLDLLPKIAHLQPPSTLLTTKLERFSPNQVDPGAYGIENVRVPPFVEQIYPDEGVDHAAITYRFDFDHPSREDPELAATLRRLVDLVGRWLTEHRPLSFYYLERDARVVLMDGRDAARGWDIRYVTGRARALFHVLDDHQPFDAIRRTAADTDEALLRARLAIWRHRGVVYRSEAGRYLNLVPRYQERLPALDTLLDGEADA